jgi:hypothetical protein
VVKVGKTQRSAIKLHLQLQQFFYYYNDLSWQVSSKFGRN